MAAAKKTDNRDIALKRKYMRKRRIIRAAERKAAGICIDCGKRKTKRNPIVGATGACKKCRTRRRNHMRATQPAAQRHARIIAWLAGNCSRCRNRKARPGGKTCEECYQGDRRSKQRARARREALEPTEAKP